MKRFGLALCSALTWFAWHVGTLSTLPANNTTFGNTGEPAGPRTQLAQLGTGLQRFAVESRQVLGHSAEAARALEAHARENRMNLPPADDPGYRNRIGIDTRNRAGALPSAETAGPSGTASGNSSEGLAMAWRQVEALFISVQPVARAGWEGLQFGWHALTDNRVAERPAEVSPAHQSR